MSASLLPRNAQTRPTLQLGAGQVDRGRVGGWPGTDDHDFAVHPPLP